MHCQAKSRIPANGATPEFRPCHRRSSASQKKTARGYQAAKIFCQGFYFDTVCLRVWIVGWELGFFRFFDVRIRILLVFSDLDVSEFRWIWILVFFGLGCLEFVGFGFLGFFLDLDRWSLQDFGC